MFIPNLDFLGICPVSTIQDAILHLVVMSLLVFLGLMFSQAFLVSDDLDSSKDNWVQYFVGYLIFGICLVFFL